MKTYGKFRITAALLAAVTLITSSSGCAIKKDEPEPVIADIISSAPATVDEPKEQPSKAESKKSTDSDKKSSDSDKKKTTDSDKKKASDSDKKEKKAESVSVSETSITLTVGDEKFLTAEVSPTKESVLWSSSNENIAVADQNGRIAALKAGICTVTVCAESDASVKAEVHVTVNNPPKENSEPEKPAQSSAAERDDEDEKPKKPESIKISLITTVLTVNQTITPEITVFPAGVEDTEVTLSTSDDSVVYINGDGSITAMSEGACTLTVTSVNYKDISDSVILTVTEPIEIKPTYEDDDDDNYDDDDGEDDTGYDDSGYPREMCYIDGVLIVNKTYSVPKDYNPGGLTPECASAFEQLRAGAAADGLNIYIVSGFRSYDTQTYLYWNYVYGSGQAAADTFSARPGHSEHQTGMAIDVNSVYDSFAYTPEAAWLAEHAHEYGFIIRYPQGKQHITGFKYEPWHIRYVGDLAEVLYESDLTIEEYFGITSVYGG